MDNINAAVFVFEVYKNQVVEGFVQKNQVEFATALLLLEYDEEDIKKIIDDNSPLIPSRSDKAREYLRDVLKLARKKKEDILKRKKTTSTSSAGKATTMGLGRCLSQETDDDKAKILAMLLLLTDSNIKKELETELEIEEYERMLGFLEAQRMFLEEKEKEKRRGTERQLL